MMMNQNKYRSMRGNIFMVLFGAVGLVGVLGVGTTQYIRGPLTTATNVTRSNLAETQMMITSQVAAVTSAQQASSGDCDSDGFVEPLRYRNAGTSPKPTGGGYIPTEVGTTTIDPWGTEYGYCVWDHGAQTLQNGCKSGGNDYRLGGGNISNQPVIALISAGKDKTFQTTCTAWVDANVDSTPDTPLIAKTSGSDDIIVKFTYAEATGMGGGLWALKSGDPDTATIAKDLEVTGGATLSGNLTFASGGLVLPDQTTSGACAAGTANQMRRNTTSTPPTLEICVNDGSPAWEEVSGGGGGGSATPGGNDTEVQYNDGGAFNGDTMLVWDETNNQLGVGSTTTYATLDLGSGTGQKLLSYADGSNGRSGLGANMGAASSYQTNLFGQNDGTNGNLSFGFVATADGTTYTEKMRLTQAGRLGIGVTAPDAPLEVNGEVILGDSSLACDASREGGIKYDTSTDTVKFCDGAGTWANIDSGGGGGGPITLSDCTADVATTPAVVQATSSIGYTHPGTTTSTSFSSLPTAGNSIIVTVYGYYAARLRINSGAVTDNQGNHYRMVGLSNTDSSDYGGQNHIFIADNIGTPTGTFTITAVHPDGNGYYDIGAVEVSGIADDVVDRASSAASTSGTTTTVTTPTLSQADELAVGVITGNSGVTTNGYTMGAGWTNAYEYSLNACSCIGMSTDYKIVSSTSAVSHVWTHDASASELGVVATFKKSSTAGSIAVVQSTTAKVENDAYGSSHTFSTNPTAGNTVIVTLADYYSSYRNIRSNDITDNQGGVYKLAGHRTIGDHSVSIFYRSNIPAPSGTFTLSIDGGGGQHDMTWGAMEVSGLDNSNSIDFTEDDSSFGHSSTSTTITAGQTTSSANTLAFSSFYFDTTGGQDSAFTIGAGWTHNLSRNSNVDAGIGGSIVTKLITTSGSSVSHTWTHSNGQYNQLPSLAVFNAATIAGSCGQILFNDGSAIGEDTFYYNKTSNSVGVGSEKTSPAAKLDINGSLRVADDATTCDSSINGAIRYNTTTNKINYCDGSNWLVPGQSDQTGTSATWAGGTGYFVLTNSTWNGNLGTLAGANAKCYTDLNANTWLNKATATSNGWVDTTHIQAFLCNEFICQNPLPSTTYNFQRSNDATKGGATFTTDSTGAGPGNATAWSGATYFGATGLTYWTGRAVGASTLWALSPNTGFNCANWEASATYTGTSGRSTDTNDDRWNRTNTGCGSTLRLVCMVHPAP